MIAATPSTGAQTVSKPKNLEVAIELLDFDPENPRFYDGSDAERAVDQATQRMVERENIDELVASIGSQDYFAGEPLLIAPNPKVTGHFVVVEGNRRLAALRILAGLVPQEQLTRTLNDAVDQATFKPGKVACFLFGQRRDVLQYLGFRHISGPRRWEPLSKARYLADLIRNFYTQLDEEGQLRAVARDIGSRRDYVAQLLTALNLYDRARAARFYDLQRVGEDDISFSLLSTALSYSNIVKFLNLPGRDAVRVDTVDDGHAKELLGWMFAQDQRGETVLGESRRLKVLAAIVGSERAIAELRRTPDLDQAYLFTTGPSETFSQLLSGIEADIAKSIALLGGDVEPDEAHLGMVGRILDNAENLQLLIQKAIRQREKRSRMIVAEDPHNG